MIQNRTHRHLPWVAALVLLGMTTSLLLAYRNMERVKHEEAFFQAIEQGNHAQIEALLRSGVTVNARRRSNPPSLWEPVQNIRTRWEYPGYPFQLGYTPLMTANICGDVWTATRLLNRGADVQALECERVGPTALELAIEYHHPAIVGLLLNRGASPNGAPGSCGPLLCAWQEHDLALMKLLLRRGAKPLPAALKKPVIRTD